MTNIIIFHTIDKLKLSAPVHRVHIECYHTATVAITNTRGNILTR